MLVALCAIVVPAAALAKALTEPAVYASSAALLFRDPGFDDQVFGNANRSGFEDPVRAAATNLELVTLREVASRAARALGPEYEPDEVAEAIDASVRGDSDVLSVTASSEDRREAATIANTVAQQFVEFRREADRKQIREARDLVLQQLDSLPRSERQRRRQLSRHAEELDVLASLQTGNAELVQRARPAESATSPRPRRDAAFGLVFGLLLGVALALAAETLDRRIHDAAELEALLARPVLATIAEQKGQVALRPAGARDRERLLAPAQMLRTSLRYYHVSREIKSVAVVSAMPHEGKTTVAWALAAAAASLGERALLVEADLRKPEIAERLGLPRQTGLSDVLGVGTRPDELIVKVPVQLDEQASASVEVLPGGRIPPNPGAQLASPEMGEFVRTAERLYDLVVVDTSPIITVADAIPLLGRVSGVLVVGRLGTARRDAIRQLRAQLDNLGVFVLGVVVNGARADEALYGYGYGRREPADRLPTPV